jgi:N-hydroxyarylamine O-acetyltransferase
MLDLDAYLERIGLDGRPNLHDVHRAHSTSIPFENLDPHRGVPVSLEPEDLERKLVTERRGGYCFEQNLLLAAALEALGMEVDLMLARVVVGALPGHIRPRSHLVLRVRVDGELWHADVGFGLGTLLEPIPFGPGIRHEQSGWPFQVLQDGAELLLRSSVDGKWEDLYRFVPEPAPLIDLEVSNWYTSTYPRSPFVTGLTVSINRADGSRLVINNWADPVFIDQTPTASDSHPLRRDEVPDLLASRFGLPGFALDANERLTLARA